MNGIKAISKRGVRSRIAKALKLHPQAVYQWPQIPAKYLLKIEKITGIPRERLRPDLYK